MVNQRQSSDRGCTQRGAYRRDFVFKVSQVAQFFVFVGVLICSTAVFAQSTNITTNNLVLTLTSPAPRGLCSTSASGIPMEFTVSNGFTVASNSIPPTIFIYAQILSSPNFSCSPTPSGTKIGEKDLAAGKLSYSATVDNFNSHTNFSNPVPNTSLFYNNVCTTNQTQTFGLCIYVAKGDAVPPTSDTRVSTAAPVILNSPTGSTTPTTTPSISISAALPGESQATFVVTSNTAYSSGFDICYFTDNTSTLVNLANDTNCSAPFLLATAPGSVSNGIKATVLWNKDANGAFLANGTAYSFKVRGTGAGNVWSNVRMVTPMEGFSTLQLYEGEGGGLSWQCAQSRGPMRSSSVLALFGILAGVFFISPMRRRRFARVFAKMSIIGLAVIFTAPAFAQLNLGINGGLYKPNLDQGKTVQVYRCLYGDAILPLLGVGLDFHVADPFGSFQLGFGLAYSWANGTARNVLLTDAECGTALQGADVAFHTIQLRPRFTYVFDPYMDYFPIVPFVRLGLVSAGYYFTYQGDPDTKGQPTKNPIGMKFGWEAGGGVMLNLDWLEPTVASRARASGVYNHTYLVAEVAYSQINDFGSGGYDLSPAGSFGSVVPLLFNFALVLELQ